MTDKQFNTPFFTEANSPVPLIPTDMAWDAMEKKLDEEKRKRRFIIWIPLRLYGLFAALFTGAMVVMWWVNYNQPIDLNTKKSNNKKIVLFSKPIPTATDADQNTAPVGRNTREQVFKPEKRSRLVKERAGRGDNDNILPFSFPERIAITNSISVQAYSPMPALLFRQRSTDSIPKKKFWVEAGIQWNVPVPFEGYPYYLKGPDGNNRFYRLLLPGIWGAVNSGRHRVIATVNPFVSAPLPARNYEDGLVPVTDSFSMVGHKQMVKIFGAQTQLQYTYRLTGNLSLGGGIDATWWKKGLVLANPLDSVVTFKPFLYATTPKKEEGIKAFQLGATLSLNYQFKTLEGVLQISKPFNKTIQGVQTPVWLRLGIRWRLLNSKN